MNQMPYNPLTEDSIRLLDSVTVRPEHLGRPRLNIQDITRRGFLIGAGSLLVLAPYGCGTKSGEGGEEPSGETRTVEHALGKTEVPVNPQRIATFTQFELEYALALGLEQRLVTAQSAATLQVGFLERQRRELDAVSTGDSTEPSIEAAAAQSPDLIVSRSGYIEQIYDELSQIAPTVGLPTTTEWKEPFRFFARVVGERERGEEVLSAYEAARPRGTGRPRRT